MSGDIGVPSTTVNSRFAYELSKGPVDAGRAAELATLAASTPDTADDEVAGAIQTAIATRSELQLSVVSTGAFPVQFEVSFDGQGASVAVAASDALVVDEASARNFLTALERPITTARKSGDTAQETSARMQALQRLDGALSRVENDLQALGVTLGDVEWEGLNNLPLDVQAQAFALIEAHDRMMSGRRGIMPQN